MADRGGALNAALWRVRIHSLSARVYGPDPATTWLSWIGDERLAVGAMPTPATLPRLAEAGVTHVVNCRARWEALPTQELALERALFGRRNVAHAPMWDTGWRQSPRRWAASALFAARALDEDGAARVFVHCKAGSHRSVLVAYAALRLRGRSADDAASLIHRHRPEAELLPAYRASVERWIGAGAALKAGD